MIITLIYIYIYLFNYDMFHNYINLIKQYFDNINMYKL